MACKQDNSSDESWSETGSGDEFQDEDEEFIVGNGETRGLFSSSEITFPSAEACLKDAKDKHGFDLMGLARKLRLDCFGGIKMVNFLRSQEGRSADPKELMDLNSAKLWADDKYMKPVLEDDPLLMLDFEEDIEDQPLPMETGAGGAGDVNLQELQNELSRLRLCLEERESRLKEAMETMESMKGAMHRNILGAEEEQGEDSSKMKGVAEVKTVDEDQSYAKSYAHFGIHHEMLSDRPRTLSYRDAIQSNSDNLFRGARVLDVGCGTGILSLFSAKAGAAKVVSVDMSSIIEQAHDIRNENKFDGVMELKKGRLEDLRLHKEEKFDIIVSEWMGYFLLYEGMLDTVLYARDNLMKKGGRILPNRCSMYLVALDDKERYAEYVEFWDDVYGFKMSCMKRPVLKEAVVEVVNPDTIVSASPAVIHTLDLESCTLADTEFASDFNLVAERDARITSLAGYFDCLFDLENKVTLSTSPTVTPTHWKQTVFYLRTPVQVKKGDNLSGHIKVIRPKNDPRALDISITIGGNTQEFVME